MSQPLSAPSDKSMRKELVRLRMEMHRQQLLYHSQPLTHPIQRVKGMIESRNASREAPSSRHPFAIGATVVLALFGKRLGKIGRLARVGLALYPIVRKLR